MERQPVSQLPSPRRRGVLSLLPGEREPALFRVGVNPVSRRFVRQEDEQSGQTGMQWGTLFRKFREAEGFTIREMADDMDIMPSDLKRYEKENRIPALQTRFQFVSYLNTFPETPEREAVKNEFKKKAALLAKTKNLPSQEETLPTQKKTDNIRGRLEILRTRHKLVDNDLAAVLGVPDATIAAWMAGRTSPNESEQKLLLKFEQLPESLPRPHRRRVVSPSELESDMSSQVTSSKVPADLPIIVELLKAQEEQTIKVVSKERKKELVIGLESLGLGKIVIARLLRAPIWLISEWFKVKRLPGIAYCRQIENLLRIAAVVPKDEIYDVYEKFRSLKKRPISKERFRKEREKKRKEKENNERKRAAVDALNTLDLTDEQLAKRLEVHKTTINRWRRSKPAPSLKSCEKIELLSSKDEKKYSKQEKRKLLTDLKEMDFTHEQIGQWFGVNPATASRWFSEDRFPSSAHCQEIESFLNDPIAFIQRKGLEVTDRDLQSIKAMHAMLRRSKKIA